MSLVSVTIPVYNQRRYLSDTLKSVSCQNYSPIELIVVDDGSTDGSVTFAREWAAKRKQEFFCIQVLEKRHKGAQAARNIGLKAASGTYIQFLDSDDIIHPYKIAEQVEFLEKYPEFDCVFTGYATFEGEPEWDQDPLPGSCVKDKPPIISCIEGRCWQTSCGLYRRECCMQIGGWDEDLPVWQDIDFNIRFHKQGFRTFYIRRLRSLVRGDAEQRISERHYTQSGVAAILSRVTALRSDLCSGVSDCSEAGALMKLAFGVYIRALEYGWDGLRREALTELNALSEHSSIRRTTRLYVARTLELLSPSASRVLWREVRRVKNVLREKG